MSLVSGTNPVTAYSLMFINELLDSENSTLDDHSYSILKSFFTQAGGLKDAREVATMLPKILSHALGVNPKNDGSLLLPDFWMKYDQSTKFTNSYQLLQPSFNLFQTLLTHEVIYGSPASIAPRIAVPIRIFNLEKDFEFPKFFYSRIDSEIGECTYNVIF